MKKANVYETVMTIPTYLTGEEEKNPMFFEKRVYQGSSGRVYPYPVIEKISDEKINKDYSAVILENEWLYVVILPELGGRIYTAYDKKLKYDFVYHNKVIKPALVGLSGPWISGGIEFNWPQHHRPTTFRAVKHRIARGNDSASVYVGETEGMFGLSHTTEIKLFDDKSYIEINTSVYNSGDFSETFLWWANPAFKVNENTATIMPTDVTAVMDHGKRAVSSFPIAKGKYYKTDYSAGVDISKYKNIPVPTSFMAYKSDFDFIGGYDYGKRAGLLHVADHRIAPGKKQWTWGCGDFGVAWDRNLTDNDGPYVELMTGCFTDNQPDFTFIAPHETKKFTQYFMPYRNAGRILNADKNICFGIDEGKLVIYSSAALDCKISVSKANKVIYDSNEKFAPTESKILCRADESCVIEIIYNGKKLIFDKTKINDYDIPLPATACPLPADCGSIEELFIFGTHIEQYRHATRNADDYYIEGLKRDPSDIRLNNAHGMSLLKSGLVKDSIVFFDKAISKACLKNSNPKNTEAFFNAGIACLFDDNQDKAYEYFYRCVWGDNKAAAFYYLAIIDFKRGNTELATEHTKAALEANAEDTRAINFLGKIYKFTGDDNTAKKLFARSLEIDCLNITAATETGDEGLLAAASGEEIRVASAIYFSEGFYTDAAALMDKWKKLSGKTDFLTEAYLLYADIQSKSYKAYSIDKPKGERIAFPNTLTDMKILQSLYDSGIEDYRIPYHLGNMMYDKKNYSKAAELWEAAARLKPDFPTVKRNLALYRFNKLHDSVKAAELMKEAFDIDKSDGRILSELYQLCKLLKLNDEELFALLTDNLDVVIERDDLYIEYLSLLTGRGEEKQALSLLKERKFHPWEGGEGKVTKLYKGIQCALARKFDLSNDFERA